MPPKGIFICTSPRKHLSFPTSTAGIAVPNPPLHLTYTSEWRHIAGCSIETWGSPCTADAWAGPVFVLRGCAVCCKLCGSNPWLSSLGTCRTPTVITEGHCLILPKPQVGLVWLKLIAQTFKCAYCMPSTIRGTLQVRIY